MLSLGQNLNLKDMITADILSLVTSDGTSTRNRNRESKISELFVLSESLSESENFSRISDFENDSLEFVWLQPKLQSKNIGT